MIEIRAEVLPYFTGDHWIYDLTLAGFFGFFLFMVGKRIAGRLQAGRKPTQKRLSDDARHDSRPDSLRFLP